MRTRVKPVADANDCAYKQDNGCYNENRRPCVRGSSCLGLPISAGFDRWDFWSSLSRCAASANSSSTGVGSRSPGRVRASCFAVLRLRHYFQHDRLSIHKFRCGASSVGPIVGMIVGTSPLKIPRWRPRKDALQLRHKPPVRPPTNYQRMSPRVQAQRPGSTRSVGCANAVT